MSGERIHQIFGSLQSDLIFRHLKCTDSLGQPYLYELQVLSEKAGLSPYDAIGTSLAAGIIREGHPERYFHGIITAFRNLGRSGGYHVYAIELRPRIWMLQHAFDCRIFQQKTVPEIIEDVIKTKHGITDIKLKLNETYKPREYCVQYRESDFNFVHRLMEQEGIYYYFDHTKNKHTLVLTDDNSALPPVTGDANVLFRPPNELAASDEHVFYWLHHVEIQSGAMVIRDFDYNKPSASLEARNSSRQQHAKSTLERYDYPGEFLENNDGTRYLKIMTEGLDASHDYVRGQAHSYRITSGQTFSLTEHPESAENKEYVVIASETEVHSGEIDQFESDSKNQVDVNFRAIPKVQRFRLPRRTPAPLIAGPQTAKVVGKNGEEIWTDALGRVKVQFTWDRVGKNDESSSCWIRVAQIWAGKAWGSMHVPRIGQEVVVEFLEGDPDRPLITGRVYNNDQTTPYALPDKATSSGIKSRSSPDGTAETFNELRFDDKKEEELIYFHAEKNFKRVVENNDELTVGSEKKDDGNQTVTIFNNQVVKIGDGAAADGSQTLEVWKDQTETIKTGNRSVTIEKGDDTLKISQGSQTVEVSKNQTETIKLGDRSITVESGHDTLTVSKGKLVVDVTASECEIKAGLKITLTVGGSSIVIEPAKITIKSPSVSIEGDMSLEAKAAMTSVSGSGVLKLEGGVVKIN